MVRYYDLPSLKLFICLKMVFLRVTCPVNVVIVTHKAVGKISKNFQYKLYYDEKSKTRVQ